ncbi:uncharacterized protein LTR77_004850 [Saxophila tyrrhenica]|uniref:Uncharacterized protein n=1 Tax=Saxophila tyrrhenica TaxID=1690608 RepID=A0AAV9PA75_9PEZI|nr:hypothetical protein LTR77_004850 [Saxophila tyrrhenica]
MGGATVGPGVITGQATGTPLRLGIARRRCLPTRTPSLLKRELTHQPSRATRSPAEATAKDTAKNEISDKKSTEESDTAPGLQEKLWTIVDAHHATTSAADKVLDKLDFDAPHRPQLEHIAFRLHDNAGRLEAVLVSLPSLARSFVFGPMGFDGMGDVNSALEGLPLRDGSSPSNTRSADMPPLLRNYYDAAGNVGILYERLRDLYFEHEEDLEEARREVNLTSLDLPHALHDFDKRKAELKDELRAAQKDANVLLQKCREQDIGPASHSRPWEYRSPPPSTHLSRSRSPETFSPPLEGSARQGSRDLRDPLYAVQQKIDHSSSPSAASRSPTPGRYAGAKRPGTTRRVTDQERHIYSRYVPRPSTVDGPLSGSIASLPENVSAEQNIDRGVNVTLTTERVPDSEQAQNRMDVPARRKLKSSRSVHSESSM